MICKHVANTGSNTFPNHPTWFYTYSVWAGDSRNSAWPTRSLWNFLRNCEWNWVWYSVIILRFLRTWPKPSMLLQNLVRQSSCLSLSRPVTPVKLKTWINDLHAGDGERQDENERQRDRGSKATKVIQDWDLQVQGFCSWCLAAPVTQVPEAFRPPISQVLVRSMKATCGFCGFTRSDLFLQPALERRPQILLQGMYI